MRLVKEEVFLDESGHPRRYLFLTEISDEDARILRSCNMSPAKELDDSEINDIEAWVECDPCPKEATLKVTKGPIDDPETVLRAEDEKIQVVFSNIGEGYCGDYNPEDPDDAELIRFDVYAKGIEGFDEDKWEAVEDASYCTTIRVDTPITELIEKIKIVFNEYRNVYDHIIQGGSVKKLGESLSWV